MLDVVQHYGPNRESSARRLARKDVVITTYHVVMWDHKSHKNTVKNFKLYFQDTILCNKKKNLHMYIFIEPTFSNKMEKNNS